MLRWKTLCFVLVLTGGLAVAQPAEAAVAGNSYHIRVYSTVSGEFTATISFDDESWILVADDGTVGIGTYTETGGPSSIVTATGTSEDGYVGEFRAMSLGNTFLAGRGTGSEGDAFRFSTRR